MFHRRSSARAGALSVAAILAVSMSASTGCGTDDAKQAIDPAAQAAVVKAADVTSKQSRGTAMTIAATIEAEGQKVSMSGDGLFDDEGNGKLKIDADVDGKATTIDEIVDDNVVYVRSDAFGDLLDGKKWLKLDVEAVAEKAGIDLDAITGGAPQSPDQALAFLKGAGKTQKLSTETINGNKTTHYRTNVDLRAAARKSSSPNAEKTVEKLIELTGSDTMPIDVWVDQQGHVRREKIHMEITQSGKTQTTDVTVDLTRFGVPLRISPPAEDDTSDALDLLKDAQ